MVRPYSKQTDQRIGSNVITENDGASAVDVGLGRAPPPLRSPARMHTLCLAGSRRRLDTASLKMQKAIWCRSYGFATWQSTIYAHDGSAQSESVRRRAAPVGLCVLHRHGRASGAEGLWATRSHRNHHTLSCNVSIQKGTIYCQMNELIIRFSLSWCLIGEQ